MGKDKKVKKGKQEADFGEEEEAEISNPGKPAAGIKKGKKGKGLDDLDTEDIPAGKTKSQVIKENDEDVTDKTKKHKKGKNVSEDEDVEPEIKTRKKKGKEKKGKRRNDASDDEDVDDEHVDVEDTQPTKKNKDRKSKPKDDDILSDNEDAGKKSKGKGKTKDEGSEDEVLTSKNEFKGKKKKAKRRNDVSGDEDADDERADVEDTKPTRKHKDRKGKLKEDDILSDNEDAGKKIKGKNKTKDEGSEDEVLTSKSESKGKKKKGKNKKTTEDSEESEEEVISKKKTGGSDNVTSSTRKAKSGFQMLEIEDMDIDDRDDDEEDEEEAKEVAPVVETKKEPEKKGKKSKKDRRKKDEEDEDLDKLLAELAIEIDGGKPAAPVEQTKAAATTTEAPSAAVETKSKKKKGKKENVAEEDAEQKGDQEEEAIGDAEGDEAGSGLKTAAQRKKEKKERERLKKLQQNQLEKTKKQKKDDQPAEVSREESQEKEATPAPMDVEDDKDDADDDDKGKKKKKKGKKGAAVEDDKADKKKPGKKAIAAMQEALKKLKEEEEKRRLEEEEKERAAEEAEQRRLEKIRLEEERKERKKQKEKEKRERLKAEGKLLSKSQKQARARAEATLQALRQQGVVLPPVGGAPNSGAPAVQQEKRGPRLGDRRRGPQKKKQEENATSPLQSPAADAVPQIEVEVVGPKEGSPTTPTTPIAEPDLAVKESWEDDADDVKEAWDESSGSEKEMESKIIEKVALSPPSAKITPTKEVVVKTVPASKAASIKEPAKVKVEKSEDEDEDDDSEEESSSEEDEDESEESSEDESDSDSSDGSDNVSSKRHEAKTRMTVMQRIRKRKDDAEKRRTTDKLRSPVVCVLGHVDTGKTKILDKIRNTHVQDGEAGGITQQIGATMVPQFALQEQCKMVKNFLNLDLKLPGLLIIDTPGHESFSNLRSRGSSLCDIAILVVDIMHGLEPQTIESLNMLKQRKTPFIVALNKIDRLYEWKSNKNKDVQDVIRTQQRNTKMEFDDKTKEVVLQFNEQGMNVALFHENPDPRTYVSIVPTSAATGDGMGNLMALVVELSQNVMAKKLAYSEDLQATVLEVKAIPGLGTTIDVILVNGCLHEGDTIVVAGHDGPVVTQIRSLLMPQPLKELRVKNPYQEFKEVEGAQGVKIAGKDLDKAIAGLQLLVAQQPDEVDILRDELSRSLKEVMNSIKLSERGVYVQASTLGSLEALLEFLRTSKIPYSGIRIGPVVKKDVMKASIMLEHDNQYAVILAFDVKVERDAQDLADSLGVKIFQADIIYHLFDKFMGYREELKQKRRDEYKHIAVFPCRLRILPQFIFNSRDPIVVGVSIEAGVLREGTPLCVPSKEFLEIGTVVTIEVNHKQQDTARKGQEVCIKIEPLGGDAPKMYGRHFDHTDALVSKITRASIDACKEHFRDDLQKADWQLMVDLKKLFQIL